jgi:hypothetical protein
MASIRNKYQPAIQARPARLMPVLISSDEQAWLKMIKTGPIA